MQVQDKVVFVTGGGSGIGQGICRAMAQEGARVVVGDVDVANGTATARELQGAAFCHLDVTDGDSVKAAVAEATQLMGRIDVLVNCAGGDVVLPFIETDEQLWMRLIDLNLTSVLRCTSAVLPQMIERRSGRIVNIASDAGRVGSSGEAAYSGAKGGVISFTKTLAREMAKSGITANSVCPGPTDTPPLRKMVAEGGERYIEMMTRAIPMRRLAQPSDIAAAAVFFASDAAGYITGQTLSVSGGLSMS